MPEQPNSQKKQVKLLIYQLESDRTFVDSFEADSFENFIMVYGDFADKPPEELEQLYETAKGLEKDKTVLMIDKDSDIKFYGFKEVEDESDDD